MILIIRFAAAKRSTAELQGLFKDAFNALDAAPRGSEDRQNTLASLEAIERELAVRYPGF